MSEADWHGYWTTFETEFDLASQPFVEVRHSKKGRDHRHRVYSLVRDDGRLVSTGNNYLRNELVSRLTELAAGHRVWPGKHHDWVTHKLTCDHGFTPAQLADLERCEMPARLSHWEHQQAERKLASGDARSLKSRIYDMFVAADGNWRQFASSMDAARITVARGRSAILVVDETTTFHLPLARLLREEAKRAGRPIQLKSVELGKVFARAKPLEDEIGRIRQGPDTTTKSVLRGQPTSLTLAAGSAAAELSKRMLDKLAADIAFLRCRRSRSEENRRRKRGIQKLWLRQKAATLANARCLSTAAYVVSCYQSGDMALRTSIQMIRAMAMMDNLAPITLAVAAIGMVYRQPKVARTFFLKRDINGAKASRSGFSPDSVTPQESACYLRLLHSFAEGYDANDAIRQLSPRRAVAFLAWWIHATDGQRDVIYDWDKAVGDSRADTVQTPDAKSPLASTQLSRPEGQRPPRSIRNQKERASKPIRDTWER